jgi:hypothetical protein
MAKKPTSKKAKSKSKAPNATFITYPKKTKGRLTTAQKIQASANKNRAYQLSYYNKVASRANTAFQNMRKYRIAAQAITRTLQTFSRGHMSQKSAMIRSLQVRATMANNNANYYTQGYLNPVYGARALQAKAVMQTLTNKQALTQATKNWKAFSFSAKQWAAYFAQQSKTDAQLAKMKAAGKTLTKSESRQLNSFTTSQKQQAAYTKATAALNTPSAQAARQAAYNASKARSARRKVVVEPSGWLHGYNDSHDTCVMTAICNQLLDLGMPVTDEDVLLWSFLIKEEPSLATGLEFVSERSKGELIYGPCVGFRPEVAGVLVGFEAETGPHAAYCFEPGKIVSWGEEMDLPDTIEEVWCLGRR